MIIVNLSRDDDYEFDSEEVCNAIKYLSDNHLNKGEEAFDRLVLYLYKIRNTKLVETNETMITGSNDQDVRTIKAETLITGLFKETRTYFFNNIEVQDDIIEKMIDEGWELDKYDDEKALFLKEHVLNIG